MVHETVHDSLTLIVRRTSTQYKHSIMLIKLTLHIFLLHLMLYSVVIECDATRRGLQV
jgi:hypothetical protein